MTSKFRCTYELDERLDKGLVKLTQRAYRTIQKSLAPQYRVTLKDNMPDPVEYYLLYTAALIYGAADAALTLVLHNLGREARLFERQVFEYWVRATFYAMNPDEARKALYSTPFHEKKVLDELGYSKTSERYRTLEKTCEEMAKRFPDSVRYREPKLKDIFVNEEDPTLRRYYALYYRVPSQMAHATIAGVGGVWNERGISFDSRLDEPNFTLGNITVFLLAFLEVLSRHLHLHIDDQVSSLKREWHSIQGRLSTSMGRSANA